MKRLTIFTPTYNRAYILHQLYESLCKQDNRDFVWLVVDDGSTDDTESKINHWIDEGKIEIKYHKQENGGKMRAHNKGGQLCDTPLFTCVDSDDYLTDNAINDILDYWEKNNKKCEQVCGMIAYRAMVIDDGPPKILKRFPKITNCTMHSLVTQHKHKGETTIVFKTDVIKQYPFPELKGEKFITEAYIYDQIDQKYTTLLFDKAVVVCKYLPDGYTRSRAEIYRTAPKGWALYFNQQSKLWRKEFTFKEKIKSVTYYIIMSQFAGNKHIYSFSNDKSIRYLIALIIAPYFKSKIKKLYTT